MTLFANRANQILLFVYFSQDNIKMKIAVMGGTFNPIHFAHLVCAEQVRESLGYEKILFIPAGQPPHKVQPGLVSAIHRFQMVLLATENNPFFEVSSVELDRVGPSYTIQTIRTLHLMYGETLELAWIIGADSLIEYKIWKDFENVLEQCSLIVTTRPNYNLEQVPTEIRDRVTIIQITGIDISATEIRNRIRDNETIRYLVPESVETYIDKHRLYR